MYCICVCIPVSERRRRQRARHTRLQAEFIEDEYARLVRRMARLERIVSEQVGHGDFESLCVTSAASEALLAFHQAPVLYVHLMAGCRRFLSSRTIRPPVGIQLGCRLLLSFLHSVSVGDDATITDAARVTQT